MVAVAGAVHVAVDVVVYTAAVSQLAQSGPTTLMLSAPETKGKQTISYTKYYACTSNHTKASELHKGQ